MLPDNGKVVVIDDKPEEVKDLFAALSSEGIPFFYYQNEEGNDLPKEPLKNIRLIFLDLLLISDEKAKPKDVISNIAARLKRILSANNGPYILIYWSTRKDEYKGALENAFENGLSDYKPFIHFELSKGADLENIKKELNERFASFETFKVFLNWESLVNNASGETVNELTNSFIVDDEWDNNLKTLLFKLAKAQLEQHIEEKKTDEIIVSAFLTATSVLSDSIESSLENEIYVKLKEFDSQSQIDETISNTLNTKIHISSIYSSNFQPGLVYKPTAGYNSLDICKKTFKTGKLESITDIEPVLLNVTPNCDYAQKKLGLIRILPGILVKKKFFEHIEKTQFRPDSQYLVYPFKYNSEFYFIVYDARYLMGVDHNNSNFEIGNIIFRLRNELLIDIQAHISNHANRPGIASVF